MDRIIGLDSGTTATKAVAVTAGATVVATCSASYPLLVPESAIQWYEEKDPMYRDGGIALARGGRPGAGRP